MKIREQSVVIGSHKRGRKKAGVTKECNLQSLAEDYSNMSRRDYLDRVTSDYDSSKGVLGNKCLLYLAARQSGLVYP